MKKSAIKNVNSEIKKFIMTNISLQKKNLLLKTLHKEFFYHENNFHPLKNSRKKNFHPNFSCNFYYDRCLHHERYFHYENNLSCEKRCHKNSHQIFVIKKLL